MSITSRVQHSHGTIVIGHFNESRTIKAASGSAKKLNSAQAVVFPTPKETNELQFPENLQMWLK